MTEKKININEENKSNTEDKDFAKKTNKENDRKEQAPEDKIKELEDKLTRTLAEMENQRRRYEKERDDAFEYGGFSFARETLNLLDNLDRSKISLESDEKLKNSDSLKKIFEHLDIMNKKLDPNFHQAMMEVEDDAKEPGTIVQEIQKGFMMKDRLLRPALVAVSKKPDNSEKKDKKVKNDEKNDKN